MENFKTSAGGSWFALSWARGRTTATIAEVGLGLTMIAFHSLRKA
jgi:hypothetical protein